MSTNIMLIIFCGLQILMNYCIKRRIDRLENAVFTNEIVDRVQDLENPDKHKENEILVTCPFCGAQIPQDEKVECECGWKAEAISLTVFGKFVNDKRTSWRNPHGDEKAYVYTVDNEPTIIKCHYINKIHWLELRKGKERDE